jgi:hypothetical protein
LAGAPAQDANILLEKGFLEKKQENALKGGDLNPQSYIKNELTQVFTGKIIIFFRFKDILELVRF